MKCHSSIPAWECTWLEHLASCTYGRRAHRYHAVICTKGCFGALNVSLAATNPRSHACKDLPAAAWSAPHNCQHHGISASCGASAPGGSTLREHLTCLVCLSSGSLPSCTILRLDCCCCEMARTQLLCCGHISIGRPPCITAIMAISSGLTRNRA